MTAASGTGSSFWRVTILPKREDLDSTGTSVLRDVHDLGLAHVRRVAAGRLFLLEGKLDAAQAERIAAELLVDPITEEYRFQRGGNDRDLPGAGFDAAIEVHLKGGVMDPVAASTLMAIGDMGIDTQTLAVSTARLYRLAGLKSINEADLVARRLLSNDCIEDVHLDRLWPTRSAARSSADRARAAVPTSPRTHPHAGRQGPGLAVAGRTPVSCRPPRCEPSVTITARSTAIRPTSNSK